MPIPSHDSERSSNCVLGASILYIFYDFSAALNVLYFYYLFYYSSIYVVKIRIATNSLKYKEWFYFVLCSDHK
jgi:hypothetical protein